MNSKLILTGCQLQNVDPFGRWSTQPKMTSPILLAILAYILIVILYSNDTYKLAYFNVKGVAEPTRMMLSIAGQQFEDIRFNPAGPDGEITPGSFRDFVQKGALDANLRRAPVLWFNGQPIGESLAMARFVARRFGFWGSNDIEGAQIDSIIEHVRDVRADWQKSRSGKSGDALESAKKEWITEKLPIWAEKLEASLTTGRDGFAVGNKLSAADVFLQQLVMDTFEPKDGVLLSLIGAPKVVASATKAQTAARDWIARRPT
jgi:glutathione S-transferase